MSAQPFPWSSAQLAKANDAVATATVVDTLAWSLETFGDRVAIASSFGAEDMLLLHAAKTLKAQTGRAPKVFTLDTGRLPEETYRLLDKVQLTFGLDVEVYAPKTAAVEELVQLKGPYSFQVSVEDRKSCCHIRKVEPLGRALAKVDAWIVGLRREQAVTRAGLDVVENDEANQKIKIAPLAALTEVEMWARVDAENIPVNALHDRGVPSIGCAPCTRPVEGWVRGQDNAHVDIRAGRWWWESPEHKECGLHPGGASSPSPSANTAA